MSEWQNNCRYLRLYIYVNSIVINPHEQKLRWFWFSVLLINLVTVGLWFKQNELECLTFDHNIDHHTTFPLGSWRYRVPTWTHTNTHSHTRPYRVCTWASQSLFQRAPLPFYILPKGPGHSHACQDRGWSPGTQTKLISLSMFTWLIIWLTGQLPCM